MVHGLADLRLRRGGRGRQPAELVLDQPIHRLELGLEILESRIMLAP